MMANLMSNDRKPQAPGKSAVSSNHCDKWLRKHKGAGERCHRISVEGEKIVVGCVQYALLVDLQHRYTEIPLNTFYNLRLLYYAEAYVIMLFVPNRLQEFAAICFQIS